MKDDLNTVKFNSDTPNPEPEKAGKDRYHHGDLREALILAGEAILNERGVEGFSLRECARRAGVSPAAPAHHFGDAKGLLTAIAARAFAAFGAALEAAQEGLSTRNIRLRAQGRAYVRFARENRAYFDLMWRSDLVNKDEPELRRASAAAFATLQSAAPAGRDGNPDDALNPNAIAAWSMVHGFARLALDGPLASAPEAFLDQVMDRLVVKI